MEKKFDKKTKSKILAVTSTVLSVILLVCCVTVWKQKDKSQPVPAEPESKSEQSQSLSVTENQSSESSTQENEENTAVKMDESASNSAADTGNSAQKPNSKPETTKKPVKPNTTTEPDYYLEGTVKYCENGQHQWDEWVIEDGQKHYRCCTKCPEQENNENWEWKPEYHMGNKSEYLAFLSLLNAERKKVGLNELQYCPDSRVQEILNIRAKDLTISFSHTRPNGATAGSLFNEYAEKDDALYVAGGEVICQGYLSPEKAFNAFMNSPKHKAILMNESATHFVCARCAGYWVCTPLYKATKVS